MTSNAEKKEVLYQYVNDAFGAIYREHTRILSSTCRQLALGEGGLCWLLKSSTVNECIAYQVNMVLILLVLFFLFDAAQYLISSILYKKQAEDYHNKISKDEIKDLSMLIEPQGINSPANVFFSIKLFILMFASLYLIFLILKI